MLEFVTKLAPRWTARRSACLSALHAATLVGITGCQSASEPSTFQGYIEAEYLYVASPQAGALKSLGVERGQDITPGTLLFTLDPEPEATAHRQAAEQLKESQARLENLRKGMRPSELASLQAKLDQAKVSHAQAEREFRRVQKLYEDGVVAIDDLDRARATRDVYDAQVQQFSAELETAHLGARADEVRAAEASVAAAEADLARAEWSLGQKSQPSPVKAIVHDTLYRPGEWVAPGRPVVVLLPPAHLKVRFFVPQSELARIRAGGGVRVSFDGARSPYPGRISYVSTQAEFTPPVIYSQQTRDKLVFMIEAKLDTTDLAGIHPGQPVDVALEAAPP